MNIEELVRFEASLSESEEHLFFNCACAVARRNRHEAVQFEDKWDIMQRWAEVQEIEHDEN